LIQRALQLRRIQETRVFRAFPPCFSSKIKFLWVVQASVCLYFWQIDFGRVIGQAFQGLKGFMATPLLTT